MNSKYGDQLINDTKDLTIDQMIQLYQDGYRIDTKNTAIRGQQSAVIRNLAADPILVSAIAYPGNGPDVWVECLFTNNSKGVLNFAAGQYVAPACTYDTTNSITACLNVSPGDSLKSRMRCLASFATTFSKACLRVQKCTSGEVCDPTTPACTSWVDAANPALDITVNTDIGTEPAAPTNLSATPGAGSLRIKWDAVTNVVIFAYNIQIFNAVGLVRSGHVKPDERDVTITGLLNDTYTITVTPRSANGIPRTTSTTSTTATITTQPSSTTAPASKSSNAGLIIAVVILAGGVVWYMSSKGKSKSGKAK